MSDKATKLKALQGVIDGLEKTYGKGTVMRLGDNPAVDIEVISTGSLGLDIALGIGGFPKGRIVEIWGPESSGKTTLTIHAIAECQKAGGTAVFIDAEHAFDIHYAKKLGVDVDNLLIAQPDNGEQALEIAENLIKSGSIDIIVIDSVAALVPKAEIDGEMGDNKVGLHAKLMSQAMRKLTGTIHRTNCCCIFINQIREKIGVLYGCFQYGSKVVLADGSTEKIGKIVGHKLPVEVLSFNEKTGEVEPKKVVGWHTNGNAEYFLRFAINKWGGNGRTQFACTPNHMIFTPTGERPAGELEVGDEILSLYRDRVLTEDQKQIAMGSLLGDGSLRIDKGSVPRLRIGHGYKQEEYLRWKAWALGGTLEISETKSETYMRSGWFSQFSSMSRRKFTKASIPEHLIANIDARAFAIWYLDDGTLSGSHSRWGAGKVTIPIKSTDPESRLRLAAKAEELGLGTPSINDKYGRLTWSGEEARKFIMGVGEYIHMSMAYKLPEYAPPYSWDIDNSVTTKLSTYPQEILKVSKKPPTRSMVKFDITVEDNHNYFVDGTLVHNSPETTTGGNALKFYASQRMDIRKSGQQVKDKDGNVTANHVKVKVVKNKLAPPFTTAEFDIEFGVGISKAGELVDLGTQFGILEKSGSWYSYGGAKVGQGRDAVKQFMLDNPEVAAEIEGKIKEAVGNTGG